MALPSGWKTPIIGQAEAYVRQQLMAGGIDSSHDWWHVERVRTLALSLAAEEGLPAEDLETVELGALLHDIDNGTMNEGGVQQGAPQPGPPLPSPQNPAPSLPSACVVRPEQNPQRGLEVQRERESRAGGRPRLPPGKRLRGGWD